VANARHGSKNIKHPPPSMLVGMLNNWDHHLYISTTKQGLSRSHSRDDGPSPVENYWDHWFYISYPDHIAGRVQDHKGRTNGLVTRHKAEPIKHGKHTTRMCIMYTNLVNVEATRHKRQQVFRITVQHIWLMPRFMQKCITQLVIELLTHSTV
jgi:hypothetical protein